CSPLLVCLIWFPKNFGSWLLKQGGEVSTGASPACCLLRIGGPFLRLGRLLRGGGHGDGLAGHVNMLRGGFNGVVLNRLHTVVLLLLRVPALQNGHHLLSGDGLLLQQVGGNG